MANSATAGVAHSAPGEDDARPRLADDVELVGTLKGAGFAEDQWLVRRGNAFVQLTELLFRVAEAAASGTRSNAEIAEHLTSTTQWVITADQVELLVEKKLSPLGIAYYGSTSPEVAPAERSPLGVHTKLAAIPANVVQAVANPLRFLFAPIVLIPALVAIGVAHAWVFLEAPLQDGLLQLLYAPGLLFVLLALLLVAGIFHELGHAGALIYGGGVPGTMGFGLLAVYPAFFTDVTDSYRLDRAGRLRTDLGGIYFHLIASLVLLGSYFISGQPFILLSVVLIDLEVVRQLIPFLKLDGYWVVADIAGIPDPYSQAMPFVRRFFGSKMSPGEVLPRLRRRSSIAFAVFLLLAVPSLIVLVILFVSGLPAVFNAGWDATIHQVGELREALTTGNLGAASLSLLQLIAAIFPIIASVYLVYFLVGRPVITMLRSGSGSRRPLLALVSVAVIAMLALVWLPQLAVFAAAPAGVAEFPVTTRNHVAGPIAYEHSPPVGGDHDAQWQNCGFYSSPVRNENAVHSLEHGAVWVTYRPDLSADAVRRLRTLAYSQIHILVSPYPGQQSPVVASAWGRQLLADSADDPRLPGFVRAFRLSSSAPEAGGPCTGGVGVPE